MHILTDLGPLTRTALQSKVEAQYGVGAAFHTCSADSMDLHALLNFLLERGKIQEDVNGLSMHGGAHICENEWDQSDF